MNARRSPLGFACIVGIAAICTGCAAPPESMYRWGEYQDLMYLAYTDPNEADPITQAQQLTEDIERTQAEGRRVPPGVHAHLGFLYYVQNNWASARAHFTRERELFPESTTFINGLLSRMEERNRSPE